MKRLFTLLLIFSMSLYLSSQNQHVQVDVQSNFYSPDALTIQEGDTVTWTNLGGTHNVNGSLAAYPDNPEGFDNGPASSAAWTFTYVFTVPGFYEYHCTPHVSLGMTGTVTVEAAPQNGPIIITEIMYNNPDVDDLEFIELYNSSDATVDLSGWSFTAGIGHTFANGTTLDAGAYLLLSINPAEFQNAFFLPSLPFDDNTALSNSGELVQLSDADGNVIDEVDYDDGGDWPPGTDGEGGSLVLCDFSTDNSDPANWQAAVTPTGVFVAGEQIFANPGGASECPDGPIVAFVFEDLEVDEDAGLVTIPVFVRDLEDVTTMVNININASSTATLGADYTVQDTMLTFSGDDDTLSISVQVIDDMDIEPLETIEFNIIDTDGNSLVDPLRDTYILSILDNDATISAIVINELMYSPPGSDAAFEYLELFNADVAAVNVDGWYFSAGITDTLPDITLQPGDFLVLASDSVSIESTFGVAALQWEFGSLSNNGELVELRDALGNVVDAVSYDDTGDWPTEADGGGSSLILCDPATDNSLATNWEASQESTGVFESGTEFLGSPGAANDCDSVPPMVTYIPYDIGVVNTENEFGVADSLNRQVELVGVVYGNNLRPGGIQVTIIDESGDGIGVFSNSEDFGVTVVEGDEILVQGVIDQFNGLTQIQVDSISKVSTGNDLVDPTEVDALNESTESQLIVLIGYTINSITAAGGGFNVEITGSAGTLLMRTDNDTGITEEDLIGFGSSNLVITGIGGQFDTSSPFDEGYQILPRYIEDITLADNTNEPEWAADVRLYPVPTSNKVTLELPLQVDFIEVMDGLGRSVGHFQNPDLRQEIDLSAKANGFYTIRIQSGSEVYMVRLLKQ